MVNMELQSRLAPLVKLDRRNIPLGTKEIRAFLCVKNENLRLPYLLEYHRQLGIGRFLIIDNGSTDGTLEYLLGQQDCHVFSSKGNFFANNTDPPIWTNALLNVFGDGHWCLTLDGDEMFVFPHCENVSIQSLCEYLDYTGANAVEALVIDMYGKAAIRNSHYERGDSFLDQHRFFDPEFGFCSANERSYQPIVMFSRFRERAFWKGRHAQQRPPCITQIPLVKWRKGMAYLVCIHTIEHAKLSELRTGILHFKFLPGFLQSIVTSLKENADVAEKGLQERKNYIETLEKDPGLSLYHSGSVEYRNSKQLVELGWLKTSRDYESFLTRAENQSRSSCRSQPLPPPSIDYKRSAPS